MSGQIFISYRRDDSAPWAPLVYTSLFQHFIHNKIFMDVDNLDPGTDFVEAIEESVGSCDVLIAVIGGRWLIWSDEEGAAPARQSRRFRAYRNCDRTQAWHSSDPCTGGGVSMPRPGDLPDDVFFVVTKRSCRPTSVAADVCTLNFSACTSFSCMSLFRTGKQ